MSHPALNARSLVRVDKYGREWIGDNTVDKWFNDIALSFTRRRYGNRVTYTWLHWWNGSEWVEEGTPWPSVVISKAELTKFFSGYYNPEVKVLNAEAAV